MKGYFLNVAQKHFDGTYRSLKNSNILHIHPTSVLYTILPEYVFYTDVILSAKNWILFGNPITGTPWESASK